MCSAAIFLLSPAASYITGTEVIVDGGSVCGFSDSFLISMFAADARQMQWQMGTNHLLGLPYPESLEDPQGFRKRMQAKL